MKIIIKTKLIPLYILLMVGCLRWFFEGVLGGYTWQSVLLLIGLIILLYVNRTTINHMNYEWILFLAGISISMIFGSGSTSYVTVRRFIVFSLIVLFAVFCNYKPERCKGCIKFIIVIAIIYSVFIIIQYLGGERFNNVFFSFLSPSSLETASYYYNNGYVYGIFFTPSDPAGLLIMTISFLILGNVEVNRIKSSALTPRDSTSQIKRTRTWILVVLLVIPLLLTGKRGIVFCGVASFVIILALHYINRGKWYYVIGIVVALIIAIFIFQYLVMTFSDNPLFSRFLRFFNAIWAGDIDDSGRNRLYGLAIQQWSNHKMFGIGWRQFSNMTISAFGYSRAHEVNCDYLQFLCETGIVGTILILIPILITLRRTVIVCRYYENAPDISPDARYMAFSAAFIQFFILIYALIEVPFNDVMFFSIYIFSVIIINGCYKQLKQNKKTSG